MKFLKIFLGLSFIFIFAAQSFAMTATESINNFAFNAGKLISETSGGDFFFSPYSIISAFGMTYAGAENATEKEFDEVLGFDKNIHSSLGKLIIDLDKEGLLSTANSVWLKNDLKLLEKYTDTLSLYYDSKAQELDFKNKTKESEKIINDWISSKTNGKIKNLLSDLKPDVQMILTNAVYFNAKWASKFNKNLTSKEKFFNNNNENNFVEVDMMRMKHDFDFAEIEGAKIIRLPYDGHRFSMIAVLPPEGEEIKKFAEKIDFENFKTWLASLKDYEVDLWLPKFKTEKRYELKEIFEKLGMKLAFSNHADFSGITEDEKLKIDAVIHQTFIELDEEKTEAAAATAITMVKATAMPPMEKPKAEFHATRPFLYFITDDYTGTILFMGQQTFAK